MKEEDKNMEGICPYYKASPSVCGASFSGVVPDAGDVLNRCASDEHWMCALYLAKTMIRKGVRRPAACPAPCF